MNLLLSVICCLLFEFKRLQCGLLCPVSCTNRVIHAFPNKTRGLLRPQNIFFWTLTAHHTLWARLAVRVVCASSSVSVLLLRQLCCYDVCRLSRLDGHIQCRTSANCAVQYRYTCMQFSESACSVRTGYVFFGTLVVN